MAKAHTRAEWCISHIWICEGCIVSYTIYNITHQTTPPYAVRQNIRVYALYTQTKPWCCRIIIKPLQCVCVDSAHKIPACLYNNLCMILLICHERLNSSTSPRFRWDSRELRTNIFTHPPPLLLQIHDNGRYTHTHKLYVLYVWVLSMLWGLSTTQFRALIQ